MSKDEVVNVDKTDAGTGTFDQIINLVSEIVVIKARLQQLMDTLVGESREQKSIQSDLQNVSGSIENCNNEIKKIIQNFSDPNIKTVDKTMSVLLTQFDSINRKVIESSLHSLVMDLDEVTGRFGKVLGELQNVLMQMRTGTSSISIMQVLLVELDEQIFAFPLESVLEIVKIQEGDIYSVDGNEAMRLRDHALGLVTLERVIGMQRSDNSTKKKTKRVVVVTNGTEQIGVVVDRLLGEEDIVAKNLSNHFRNVKGVSGATILGDGCVALILEVPKIIEAAQKVCPAIDA